MTRRRPRFLAAVSAAAALIASVAATALPATGAHALDGTIDITAPPGSGCFGWNVVPLPNGNVVITDPCWKNNVGAAYLYDGATHQRISTLTGTSSGDRIGQYVEVLTNGNYVLGSWTWAANGAFRAGAVTWASATTGVDGVVSAANSVVGSSAGDQVGYYGAVQLTNGNAVVAAPLWDRGNVADAGAVTWIDGTQGSHGQVGPAISLVGSSPADVVGIGGVTALASGNYVVASPEWNNGGVRRVGAATWGDGTKGVTGSVSASNSLVGAQANDAVGDIVVELENGNYVVDSTQWANGAAARAGAVTFGNGATGVVGAVTAANSLVGTQRDDVVGFQRVWPLANGNYAVASPRWHNGVAADAGAVTWGDGTVGVTGPVTTANSLVGVTANALVGEAGVTPLTNGNYVVNSPHFVLVGAATWADGSHATAGVVDPSNSLTGSVPGDQVGLSTVALANGNYLVVSTHWHDGATADAGAATWGNGGTGTTGVVSGSNSIVGTMANDGAQMSGVVLPSGAYLVSWPRWDNGAAVDAGAVTWADGSRPTGERVAPANSLVGSAAGDLVSFVTVLTNGNYVVLTDTWDRGALADAGAITWGSGTSGVAGPISPTNSLVGSHAGDMLGYSGIAPLPSGNFVVGSSKWNAKAGAATWGDGGRATTGEVGPANSLVGLTAGDEVGSYVLAMDGDRYAVRGQVHVDGRVAGSVTVSNAPDGITGGVTAANSVVTTGSGPIGYQAFAPVHRDLYVPIEPEQRMVVVPPPAPVVPPPTTTPPATSAFQPLVPARLLETRSGQPVGTVDGQFQGAGLVPAGGVVELPVAGRGGVGADADAVVLNVAITGTSEAGFVTVYPCGADRPLASNLNHAAGQTIANAVTAKVGADGKVCLFTHAAAHLVVDVDGWYPPGSGFVAMNPARLLETRSGQPRGTVDGQSEATGALATGSITELTVTGRAGIPGDARAVVLNLAVTDPQAAGFLTVFPCGAERPLASSINFAAGQTIANAVVVQVGAGGKVCVYAHAATHAVIDANGYHTASSAYVATAPQRILETRAGQPQGTVDGQFQATGRVGSGAVVELQVTGRAGVPASATAVVLNVAVVDPSGDGFVTVYPCGADRPNAANVVHGATIAGAVTAKVGEGGKVCLFTYAATDLVVDLEGRY